MTILYGIPNCDTVRKARAWLTAHDVAYRFHDFKKQGMPADRLDAWLAAVGPDRLINRKGTTWRGLDASAQSHAGGIEGARSLAMEQPSIVKRPVVEWADGTVTVGFSPDDWAQMLAGAG